MIQILLSTRLALEWSTKVRSKSQHDLFLNPSCFNFETIIVAIDERTNDLKTAPFAVLLVLRLTIFSNTPTQKFI